jgi:hypothetical protein
MKIIRQRERKEEIEYVHDFVSVEDPSRGFAINCSESGQPIDKAARERYAELQQDVKAGKLRYKGLRMFAHRWTEPAVGRCHCGREVVLDGFTNTCRCGSDYNFAGQALAPRSQWGEETGESLADILSIK